MESELFTQTTLQVPSAHQGWNLDVWKFMPRGKSELLPVIIMAHGLSANKSMGLRDYASAFAASGYACLVFDYRRWGASGGSPRHVALVKEQLEDYRTMIKYARHQPEFDPQRVIVWGTSFSGGHAITLASEPSLNLYAAIAQCPYTGVTPISGIHLSLTWLETMGCALYDMTKQLLGLSPSYIPAMGAPGTVGAMTTPGCLDGMKYLVKDEASHYPNEISASSIFQIFSYKPLENASKIECPLILIAPEEDNLCSMDGALKVVQDSKNGELVKLQKGKSECTWRCIIHLIDIPVSYSYPL
ncbi:hypothetical protein AX16_008304 [Volvariella volvacea WC 439]|nr:hypothetical protein AX16_008304 [Volvariella volvacea WC 439]